jgi:hypothetical protein
MKTALLVVSVGAAVATGLRLLGVLPATTLIPATLLGVAMILMMLYVVAESDRKY